MNEALLIPTWSTFYSGHVCIEILENECEKHGQFYYSALTFNLDNEEQPNVNSEKWISLVTDIRTDTIDECIKLTAQTVLPLFGEQLHNKAYIMDENGDSTEVEIDFSFGQKIN